jgi:methyltransferase
VSTDVVRTALSALVVIALLLVETRRSRRNEEALRALGAIEPADDVYRIMQIAYPLSLLSPFGVAAFAGPAATSVWTAGAGLFLAAKALKFWAIQSLGRCWTFRVLVVPGAPLVTSGPYRFMRHPNYVAVAGEIVGVSVMCGAPILGALCLVVFGALMLRRIAVEERALRSVTSRADL